MKVFSKLSEKEIKEYLDQDDGFVDFSVLQFSRDGKNTSVEGPPALIGCMLETLAGQDLELNNIFL